LPIDLTSFAEAINGSRDEGTPCVVATNGPDGIPDIGMKGSMMVFDQDHLAYWERTRGQHYANVQERSGIAVLYLSFQRGMMLRAFGHAEVHESGPIREQILSRVVESELQMDPERQGIGVLIRVDRLQEAFSGTEQRREE